MDGDRVIGVPEVGVASAVARARRQVRQVVVILAPTPAGRAVSDGGQAGDGGSKRTTTDFDVGVWLSSATEPRGTSTLASGK